MRVIHLEVQGMRCGSCVKTVTAALKRLPGVSSVEVDLPMDHVTVNGDFSPDGDALVLALTAAGYPAKLTEAITTPAGLKKSGACCG